MFLNISSKSNEATTTIPSTTTTKNSFLWEKKKKDYLTNIRMYVLNRTKVYFDRPLKLNKTQIDMT